MTSRRSALGILLGTSILAIVLGTPSASAVPARTAPTCVAAQLRLSLDHLDAGLGHAYAVFFVTNEGIACTVRGVPSVRLLIGDMARGPVLPAYRNLVSTTVTLRRRQSALFTTAGTLTDRSRQRCAPHDQLFPRAFQVTLPGQTRARVVINRDAQGTVWRTCATGIPALVAPLTPIYRG